MADPVAHLEIDPGALSEDDRHLIADHLNGITLYNSRGALLTAEEPTLEGILQALRAEQEHDRRRAETREAFQGPPRLVQPSKKAQLPRR